MILCYNKVMRKKLTTKTHTRDVIQFETKMFDEDKLNCFVVVKKIDKTSKPFRISTEEILVDDGYLLIEITPKNESYNIRVFLDKERNILQHYIDICKITGFDEEENSPFYDDLFLDIVISKNGEIRVLDEDELSEALECGTITKEDFDFAIKIKDKILREIQEKTNDYLNLNIERYF